MEFFILKKEVFSGFFWKFWERITAQAVSLIVSIILARKLLPSEYGIVSFVMIFITIANVFVSSGLGNALIQKKEADNVDFSTVFYINILLGVFIYSLIFFIAPFIARYNDLPILKPVMRVLGIRIIIASINSVQQAYVSRKMMFKCFFWSTLIGTLISGIVGVILAYDEFGVWALVFQYLTNAAIDTLVLWITVKWRPQMSFSINNAKTLFAYGWKILISGLLDTGYKQIRSFIIGGVYSSADLAFYDQGNKYTSFIVTNVNSSISSVIFPALSQYQNDTNKIKEMTRKVIRLSSFFLWPCMLGFATVAKSFVCVVLTDKWLPCVPYIQVFCISYGFWPIHTANLQSINAMGRSDIFLKLEIIKKVVGVIAIILSLRKGPMALAISAVIVDIIATAINAFPNKKLLNYSYWEQLKDMLPSFILSLIMCILIYPLSFLHISSLFVLILQVVGGIILYILLCKITRLYAWKYATEIVKSYFKHDKL